MRLRNHNLNSSWMLLFKMKRLIQPCQLLNNKITAANSYFKFNNVVFNSTASRSRFQNSKSKFKNSYHNFKRKPRKMITTMRWKTITQEGQVLRDNEVFRRIEEDRVSIQEKRGNMPEMAEEERVITTHLIDEVVEAERDLTLQKEKDVLEKIVQLRSSKIWVDTKRESGVTATTERTKSNRTGSRTREATTEEEEEKVIAEVQATKEVARRVEWNDDYVF